MKFDHRSGYLFVARGSSGFATVIDAASGVTVTEMQFATPSATTPTFVNDVIVTRTAAYLTDSRRPPCTGFRSERAARPGPLFADGNVLAGRTLYVMQNLSSRMAVVELSHDYLSGTVERHIVGADPMTTMARFGNALYAVTAGFGFLLPPASSAGHPFQVVRFDMR